MTLCMQQRTQSIRQMLHLFQVEEVNVTVLMDLMVEMHVDVAKWKDATNNR